MRIPRFRIAGMMVVVAIAALDFWAIRLIYNSTYPNSNEELHRSAVLQAWVAGVLPSLHILAAGILIGYRRPRWRPFLLGFESLGVLALIAYVILTVFFMDEVVQRYLNLVVKPLWKAVGPDINNIKMSILFVLVTILLGVPQLTVALIGGLLSLYARRRKDPTP